MKTRHLVEASALDALLWMLGALSPKRASKLGGSLMAAIGPLLKAQNKRVDRHLALAFPDKDEAWRTRVRLGMWRHLGMTIAEYPHLNRLYDGHPDFSIEIKGLEHTDSVRDGPLALVSAHVGNWEVLPILAAQGGLGFHSVYRPPNNPLVAERLKAIRSVGGRIAPPFPKSRAGMRHIAETLKKGGRVAFLIDQRHSRGPAIPFFGRPAEVTPIAAELARKYGAPILPGRIKRRGPCDFLLEIYPPMAATDDPMDATRTLYALFEDWIRDAPEQWLWTHRRWGKDI